MPIQSLHQKIAAPLWALVLGLMITFIYASACLAGTTMSKVPLQKQPQTTAKHVLQSKKAPSSDPTNPKYQGLVKQAEKGDIKAMLALAEMRRTGNSVAKQLGIARTWYTRAANANDSEAQYQLGLFLLSDELPQSEGSQLPMLTAEGIGWLRKSAQQGFVPGQKALGKLLLEATASSSEGQAWLEKAALSNDTQASAYLGQWYLDRYYELGGQERTIFANQALRYLNQAANSDDAASQNNLASMHMEGIGTPPNPELAAYWYRKAAGQLERNAAYNLAILLLQNRIQPIESDQTVVTLLTNAAQQNFLPAQRLLAKMFLDGQRIPQQLSQAAAWFERAANLGDVESEYQFGLLLQQGIGIEQNPQVAAQWLLKAARKHYAPAQYAYGMIVLSGMGDITSNAKTAQYWITHAADQGYRPAEAWVGRMQTSVIELK